MRKLGKLSRHGPYAEGIDLNTLAPTALHFKPYLGSRAQALSLFLSRPSLPLLDVRAWP